MSRTIGGVLFGAMAVIWGASNVFTELALRGFGPITLVVIRMGIAAVLLGAVMLLARVPFPRSGRTYLHLAALGALNVALPYVLLTWALVHVNAVTTSVLGSTVPIFVFLLAGIFHADEHFTLLRTAGIMVAFAGILLLYGVNLRADGWIWPTLVVLSSAVFASGNVYTRTLLRQTHPLPVAFLQLAFGGLYLVPFALVIEGVPRLPSSPSPILAALELGVLGSAVAYLLYFTFIRHWGSTRASMNTYLQPAVGIVLGIVALDERVRMEQWLALAVVLGGVVLFGWSGYRDAPRGVVAGVDVPAALGWTTAEGPQDEGDSAGG